MILIRQRDVYLPSSLQICHIIIIARRQFFHSYCHEYYNLVGLISYCSITIDVLCVNIIYLLSYKNNKSHFYTKRLTSKNSIHILQVSTIIYLNSSTENIIFECIINIIQYILLVFKQNINYHKIKNGLYFMFYYAVIIIIYIPYFYLSQCIILQIARYIHFIKQ